MQQLVIISGLSGSGKSIALQTLEDEGFFCVDNLPLTFVPQFLEKFCQQERLQKLAIGIDARGFPEDFSEADTLLQDIQSRFNIMPQLIFLEASNEVLIKRYSHTRRKHPLSLIKQNLADSILYERELIAPLKDYVNIQIDTSNLNVHELRSLIKERLFGTRENSVSLQIISFGYRNGLPLNADFVFDARALTNPHWEPALRDFNGMDPEIKEYFKEMEDIQSYYQDISSFIKKWLPKFKEGTRSYLTIAIGCTGGQHRSVYLAQRLFDELEKEEPNLYLKHREISR